MKPGIAAALTTLVVLSATLLVFAQRHIQTLLQPPLALSRPIYPPLWGNSTYLCPQRTASITRLPYRLHLQHQPTQHPQPTCHLLPVPGTATHASAYWGAVGQLSAGTGCHVWGVDLMGSGRSGGDRGRFTLEDWVADIRAAAEHIQQWEREQPLRPLAGQGHTPRHLPIVLLGSSMGGEVAWQALRLLPQSLVPAAVSMNIFLSPRLSPSRLVSALRHPLLRPPAAQGGPRACPQHG